MTSGDLLNQIEFLVLISIIKKQNFGPLVFRLEFVQFEKCRDHIYNIVLMIHV